MPNSLCQLAGEWQGAIPAGGLMCEEKRDGLRGLAFRGIDGVHRLWSRNGYFIEGTGHILHRLRLMERVAGEPWFFDGEFQVDGTLAATKAWFEREHKFGGEAGVLYLFDGMPEREWKAGGTATPLYERKARVQALMAAVDADTDMTWEWRPGSRGRDEGCVAVEILPDTWVSSPADAMYEANFIWAVGGEGCMLKDAMGGYQRTRSATWQKIKPGGPWWRKLQSRAISFARNALSRSRNETRTERNRANVLAAQLAKAGDDLAAARRVQTYCDESGRHAPDTIGNTAAHARAALDKADVMTRHLGEARLAIARQQSAIEDLGDALDAATSRAIQAERALAAVTARRDGWPPAVRNVSVSFGA